jgi:hypothetical protein
MKKDSSTLINAAFCSDQELTNMNVPLIISSAVWQATAF